MALWDGLEQIVGSLKWFDTFKGYGFIIPDDGGGDILLHLNSLRKGDIEHIKPGARISCYVLRAEKTTKVVRIIRLEGSPEGQTRDSSTDSPKETTQMAVPCPKCSADSKVTDCRLTDVSMRRRRECVTCQHRWTTYELAIDMREYVKVKDIAELLQGVSRMSNEIAALRSEVTDMKAQTKRRVYVPTSVQQLKEELASS